MKRKTDKTPEISAADYRLIFGLETACPKPKKNKYNAKSTIVDGVHFPSQLEAAVWCQLQMWKKTGEVLEVKRYPSVKLPGGITWKIDFAVNLKATGWEYHEAKGFESADYRLKLKLYTEHGEYPLVIWKGTAASPFILKTILPNAAITDKKGETNDGNKEE